MSQTAKAINIFSFVFLLGLVVFVSPFVVNSNEKTTTAPTSILAEEKKAYGLEKLLGPIMPYPINQNVSIFPEISANSVYVIDPDSMTVLYEKNAEEKVFPASTTKIMTALIGLDNFGFNQPLQVYSNKVSGSVVNLKLGEEISFENLLYSLLVASGNDAAQVLADNFKGGQEKFIQAMNQKAQQLNLKNTHFTNSMGLDEDGHYSTAKDLAILSSYAIKNEKFKKIVSVKETNVLDLSGKTIHLENTNELLGKVEGVMGIKTGWTERAGECLISLTERNNRKVISVVLGSSDRFGESKKIIDWVYENFTWQYFLSTKWQ